MPDYLADYKAYYQLRVKRYEGDPSYKNSYESEKAICHAIASCKTLEEFKDKLGNLNEKNASALIIDEYTLRLNHYNDIKESIRADGCRRIIEKAKNMEKVAELVTMVNAEEQKTMLAITTDSISPFNDSGYLERMEIWTDAEIPAKYKARYQQYAAEEKVSLQKAYAAAETGMNNFQPGWKFNFTLITEERHRRLLPYPDEVIRRNIKATQSFLRS